MFGYKHPLIIQSATKIFSESGFFVSVPTKALLDCSEKLVENFKLPFWRFTNSGTEATLDAIRLSRARYGRDYIIKVESGYHGHHDSVWISIHAGERDDGAEIPSTPFCSGIPTASSSLTLVAEFNNLKHVQNYIDRYPDQIACVIVEPVLLNCSMIKPINGYLQSLIDLCRPLGIAVIFDIVKLNTAVSFKNISQFWDSSKEGPDMFTLGKGLSGGACPIGGIGMTKEFADIIESFSAQVSGTYNGNSFAMGMVRTVQNYVTEEKQAELEALSRYMYEGCKEIVATAGLNAIVDYLGNKGCITFLKKGVRLEAITHYQEYIRNVDLVLEQLFVFFNLNRGCWIQPRDEWSISYQHTRADADKYLENLALFCDAVKGLEHEEGASTVMQFAP